jgi:hypothetical protein
MQNARIFLYVTVIDNFLGNPLQREITHKYIRGFIDYQQFFMDKKILFVSLNSRIFLFL